MSQQRSQKIRVNETIFLAIFDELHYFQQLPCFQRGFENYDTDKRVCTTLENIFLLAFSFSLCRPLWAAGIAVSGSQV